MDLPRRRKRPAGPDPLVDEEAPSFAGVRRDLGRIPPARLLVTATLVLAAILFARFSWHLPLTKDAERMFYDVRALQSSLYRAVPQDPRILLVTYTPETLAATGKRSPLDRAILARALANIDRMGATAIGIDILIDQPQPEDRQLVSALRKMNTPVWLAYAGNSHNARDIEPWQQEFLDKLFQSLSDTTVRPSSIRLEADPDNVIRSWPDLRPDLPPFLPMALAGKPDEQPYTGNIRFRMPEDVERKVFLSLPIDLLANPDAAPLVADQVRGRIVMIGGDLPDVDQFTTPESRLADPTTAMGRQFRETLPGLEVHATLLAQLLDGETPPPTNNAALWMLAALVVLSGAFTAMLDVRPWVLALVLVGQFGFYVITPYWLQNIGVDTGNLPAFGWLGGWLLAFIATGAAVRAVGSDQRRFAQTALGKYLPRDIAAQIIRNPDRLSLTGEKRPIFALFTDLQGFTELSHSLPPETVVPLLNTYLDGMCDIVLEHGGTIDKFVGDAIVAFWGAPIARFDDGERAARAMHAMIDFARTLASSATEGSPRLGRTRVGVHYGEAIVGNFGGQDRFQYTALGDVMNCAARLESANKLLKTAGLISDTARRHATTSAFRPMGRIILSGRPAPIVVWEPASNDAVNSELARLWQAFDSGNVAALHELRSMAERRPEDAALQLFVYRLAESGPGGAFEFREK